MINRVSIMSLLSCFFHPKKRRSLLTFCKSIDYWQNNPHIVPDDVEICRRIIKAYNSQTNHLDNPNKTYERREVRQKEISKLTDLLDNNEPFGLAYMLNTFRRNSASSFIATSLYGFNLCRWGIRTNSELVCEAYESLNKIKSVELLSSIKLGRLHKSILIGNPYVVNIDGNIVDSYSLHCLNHVYAITNTTALPYDGDFVFADIGSGFGFVACLMLEVYQNSTFILIDLPETLAVASYVMAKLFPDKKIAFFNDIKNINNAIAEFDILLIPHWFADQMPNESVDLFMNMTSLIDMPKSEYLRYMSIIDRCLKKGGAFYSYNPLSGTINEDGYGYGYGLDLMLNEAKLQNHFIPEEYPDFRVSKREPFKSILFRRVGPV